jgi:hypothetical protein
MTPLEADVVPLRAQTLRRGSAALRDRLALGLQVLVPLPAAPLRAAASPSEPPLHCIPMDLMACRCTDLVASRLGPSSTWRPKTAARYCISRMEPSKLCRRLRNSTELKLLSPNQLTDTVGAACLGWLDWPSKARLIVIPDSCVHTAPYV